MVMMVVAEPILQFYYSAKIFLIPRYSWLKLYILPRIKTNIDFVTREQSGQPFIVTINRRIFNF